MEDIFLIVAGDEILAWGEHESYHDVLNAFFRYDADRLGEDHCLKTYDYNLVLNERANVPCGEIYDVIHAPFSATSVVENTRSLSAVTKEFLCQKYNRLVRSKQVAVYEDGLDLGEVSRRDSNQDLVEGVSDVKNRRGRGFGGVETRPFLMASIGSYACFVDCDLTTVH